MRTLALAILMTAGLLQAEPPQVAVSVLEPVPPKLSAVPLAVYGGTTIKLRLAVDAPIGTTLAINAELLQVARTLVVPLNKSAVLAEALAFTEQTHQVIEAPLALPEVERSTQLLVRVQTRRGDQWQPAGKTMLSVYPREQPGTWNKFFVAIEKEHGLRLAIFGKSPRLREFLRGEDVPFHDAGTEPPAAYDKDLLYLGEQPAEAQTPLAGVESGGRVIVFSSDAGMLAGVYTSTGRNGVATKVTLPLLDDLSSNPRTRQTFTDIIQQHLVNHR